jgi:serine/threonine-protein kinase
MGVVYVVKDHRLHGSLWVMKWQQNTTVAMQEANILLSLRHQAIPRLVDAFAYEGGMCLVMDYIQGQSLLERSAREAHRMSWQCAVRYAIDVCAALAYLHAQNPVIVFRDLKPSHILIDVHERVHLIDFGIARTYKAGHMHDTVHMGSIGFASPELRAHAQTDARTDIYALGCVLFFVLSGGQYYPLTQGNVSMHIADVPASLCETLTHMLHPEMAQRITDVRHVQWKFERLLATETPSFGSHFVSSYTSDTDEAFSDVKTFVQGTHAATRSQHPFILVVCGVFSGAGATLIAHSVVYALHQAKQQATYVCLAEQETEPRHARSAWLARAHREEQVGSPSWIILDAGGSWSPDACESWCTTVDGIVGVVSPDVRQLEKSSTICRWQRLHTVKKRVFWVANRMPRRIEVPHFHAMFPNEVDVRMPEMDYEDGLTAQWSGHVLPRSRVAKKTILRVVTPLIQRWLEAYTR